MTEKEILKALDCCQDINETCNNCPLQYRRSADCVDYLTRNAKKLIEQLRAERQHADEAMKLIGGEENA